MHPQRNDASTFATDTWLTVAEVAERFDLSTHAVYRRIRSGAWSSFVTHFGKTLISSEGLEHWLRAGGDDAACRIDSDHREQARANTGRRSSRARTASSESAAPAVDAKQKLERLLNGGTERPRFRVLR